jgi:hypothetical protein
MKGTARPRLSSAAIGTVNVMADNSAGPASHVPLSEPGPKRATLGTPGGTPFGRPLEEWLDLYQSLKGHLRKWIQDCDHKRGRL